MARTTPDLVRGIVEVDPSVDLTPFITMANLITTDLCVYTTGVPYSEEKLTIIETWLAAHFLTSFDNQVSASRAGTAAVTFQNKIDYGLRSSIYGQQAILADTRGNLAKYNNSDQIMRRIRLRIIWMGRRRESIPDGLLWPDSAQV